MYTVFQRFPFFCLFVDGGIKLAKIKATLQNPTFASLNKNPIVGKINFFFFA